MRIARESALARRRAIVATAAGGACAGIALTLGASWSVAALSGSDAAAMVFVARVWLGIARADAPRTARLARAEDASRIVAEGVLVGAGAASLIAVAFTLAEAGDAVAPSRGLLTGLAIASVALAHTVWVLRYARLYHSLPEGGIDFGAEDPDYAAFAYLALTIGMTFQVSDTDLSARHIRRAALRHALLSYLFGTVIVAITVSTVPGLVT